MSAVVSVSTSEPRRRRNSYRYGSIRHSLARRKILRQSGPEHTQIGRVDTHCQQLLPSRNVPEAQVISRRVQVTLEKVHLLLSRFLRNDHIFLKGVEEHN